MLSLGKFTKKVRKSEIKLIASHHNTDIGDAWDNGHIIEVEYNKFIQGNNYSDNLIKSDYEYLYKLYQKSNETFLGYIVLRSQSLNNFGYECFYSDNDEERNDIIRILSKHEKKMSLSHKIKIYMNDITCEVVTIEGNIITLHVPTEKEYEWKNITVSMEDID